MADFSKRTAWSRKTNALANAIRAAQANGRGLLDLTCTNPIKAGFIYASDQYAHWLDHAPTYEPFALGLPTARKAIEKYVCSHSGSVHEDHIWIASSTSELFHHLMILLSNPGDEWLVPTPGYPLLDFIADMAEIKLISYPLIFDHGWHLDANAIQEILVQHPSVRVLVATSPHNPTGHALSLKERSELLSICAANNIACVVDEVFLDYPLDSDCQIPTMAIPQTDSPIITLSGLSKVAALPQAKVAWATVNGPASWVEEFMDRAILIADTFLSVSPPFQAALPAILQAATEMQERIRSRCARNVAEANRLLQDSVGSVLEPVAGWALLLRMPATKSDEEWAMQLIERYNIVMHPGYFFDLAECHKAPLLAVSLLTNPTFFSEGIKQLAVLLEEQA